MWWHSGLMVWFNVLNERHYELSLYSLSPEKQRASFQPILPGEGLLPVHGMIIEAILTFNLVFVALSCTDPTRKSSIMPSFPIAFCIGTGILAAVSSLKRALYNGWHDADSRAINWSSTTWQCFDKHCRCSCALKASTSKPGNDTVSQNSNHITIHVDVKKTSTPKNRKR